MRLLFIIIGFVVWATGSAVTGGLEVSNPQIRATAPGMTATGGYLTITNHGGMDERLISVSADFAGRVEIHEMIMNGEVMKMREREGGIEIPAGGMAMLKSGGLHLMLMELRETMVPGEMRDVTLTFQSGHSVTIPAMVMRPGDMGGQGHGHNQKHGTADHN